MTSTLKTALGIRNEEGTTVIHDITSVVGQFNPKMLCYLTGIREVYMTMANTVDALDFVECLPFLPRLHCVIIHKCTQFHESHIVKVAENNKMIKYLDVTKSTKLSFEAVHYILGTLNELFYFAFDPKYAELGKEWRNIIRIFRYKNIQFGGEICVLLDEN